MNTWTRLPYYTSLPEVSFANHCRMLSHLVWNKERLVVDERICLVFKLSL
jgi:hypothetical protein